MKRYGKLPAIHSARSMRSALALARHIDQLGPAPASSGGYYRAVEAAVGGPNGWGMFLNERIGDCTIADRAHKLMLRTANAGQMIVPADTDVLNAYSGLTGYDPSQADAQGNNPTDRGADEISVCKYDRDVGLCGHKSENFASVDWHNADHLKWAIQLFGGVSIGIQVPGYMENQFDLGETLHLGPSDALLPEGHDIYFCDYEGDVFEIVTWGRRVQGDLSFLRCVDECLVELYPDWITAAGTAPSGLDMAGLVADLAAVDDFPYR